MENPSSPQASQAAATPQVDSPKPQDWQQPEISGKKPITVPLEDPVKHGGQMLTSLTLQPLKGRAMKKLPVDPSRMTVGDVMAIAAVQAQVPDSLIDDLTASDLTRVLGVTNGFLGLILGDAGETS